MVKNIQPRVNLSYSRVQGAHRGMERYGSMSASLSRFTANPVGPPSHEILSTNNIRCSGGVAGTFNTKCRVQMKLLDDRAKMKDNWVIRKPKV